jgi:hypothetical protein
VRERARAEMILERAIGIGSESIFQDFGGEGLISRSSDRRADRRHVSSDSNGNSAPLEMNDVEVQRPEQRRDIAADNRAVFPFRAFDEEMKPFILRRFRRDRVTRHEGTRRHREAEIHAIENFTRRRFREEKLAWPLIAHVARLPPGAVGRSKRQRDQ